MLRSTIRASLLSIGQNRSEPKTKKELQLSFLNGEPEKLGKSEKMPSVGRTTHFPQLSPTEVAAMTSLQRLIFCLEEMMPDEVKKLYAGDSSPNGNGSPNGGDSSPNGNASPNGRDSSPSGNVSLFEETTSNGRTQTPTCPTATGRKSAAKATTATEGEQVVRKSIRLREKMKAALKKQQRQRQRNVITKPEKKLPSRRSVKAR